MSRADNDEGIKARIRHQILKAAVDGSDVVTKSATSEEIRKADNAGTTSETSD